MRKSLLALAGVAALALGSVANAAVTVDSGSVVNLNNPNPSATNPVNSIQTVGDVTTINFGLNPIVNNAGDGSFMSQFTITDPASAIYAISVGTSSDGVLFTSGTLVELLSGGGMGTPISLDVTDGGLGLRLGPPGPTLAGGNYQLTVNGTSPGSGSFTGNVTITTAVPEPATWAMMLVGFGAIGFSMRSRRRGRVALAQIA